MDVPEEGGPRRQPSLRRSTKNIARDAAQAAGASSAAPSATAGENAETLGPSSKGKMPLSPNASSRHTTTSSNTVTTPTSPSLANSPRLGKTWAQRAASSSSATAGGGTGAQRRDSASTQRKVSMMAPPRSNSKVRLSAATTSNHSDDASDTGSAPGETRPPALSRNSTRDNLLALQQSNPSGDPDDEISRHDRGEELIRRRMKERKAEKKRLAAVAAREQQLQAFQPGSRLASSHQPQRPLSSALSHRIPSSTGLGGLTDNELSELEDETGGGTTLKRPPMPRRRTQGSDNSTPQSPSALRTQDVTQRFGLESTAESRPTPPGRRVSYAFSASQASTPGDEVDKSSTFDSELQTAREAEQQDVAAHETAEEAEPDSDGDTSRGGPPGEVDDPGDDDSEEEDVEYTLKDRQDAINIEHPFGLPIWKPALYKKSRSVTRNADANLHLAPSSQAEHHLAPGNIVWTLLFGLWLALACIIVSAILWLVPWGGSKYGRVVFELGVYLFWPFGRYVEGWDQDAIVTTQDGHTQVIHALGGATAPTTPSRPHSIQTAQDSSAFSEADSGYNDSDGESLDLEADGSPFKGGVQTLLERERMGGRRVSESSAGHGTIRLRPQMEDDTTPPASRSEGQPFAQQQQTGYGTTEETSRQGSGSTTAVQDDYNLSDAGTMSPDMAVAGGFRVRALGRLSYWLVFYLIVAPAMLFICLICWFSVFTIPMAKLLWVLVRHLHREPLAMHFRSAPKYHHPATQDEPIRPPPPLKAGQFAPKHSPKVYEADRGAGRLVGPKSKIILCTYKAFGMQYYKYTVDGVNIIFVNLIPVIFFTIFCDFVLRRGTEEHGEYKNGLLAFISNQATIFVFGLASVIPLSYFIGMAVASISAQSSIGMGAVINATFGSIIEIILYSIALSQGKANLVEGSIIGSLIAGVLLMPGGSMISGAFRRKEQRFNARSAGVTSTMLIMAIIGTLTPTLFYEIYGTFQLTCEGCPDTQTPGGVSCARCSYEHIDPADDPFYKGTVRYLSYVCASILVLSYLIGLWFSLRTHASQIWQNSQGPPPAPSMPASATLPQHLLHPAHKKSAGAEFSAHKPPTGPGAHARLEPGVQFSRPQSAMAQHPEGSKTAQMSLPEGMSADEYRRAYDIVASASAFHHNQALHPGNTLRRQPSRLSQAGHPRDRSSVTVEMHNKEEEDHGGHGGHDAPNWSRLKSYSVLLGCTLLYAIIAEILVDVVDVVLEGSGIPEKFLGVTLFALVPNTTEFMNAFSFALTGNIALSMEIGSAYALQVCLLQIPAMVIVTYVFSLSRDSMLHHAFTLVFPRWDVIAILFAVFLLTYVYLEARANYYRGSILVFSYLVLLSGFYFTPSGKDTEDNPEFTNNSLRAIFPADQSIDWLTASSVYIRSLFAH